jgi:prepilin-type N-terminal cleavage/methylation domain-containing protein
MNKGFSLVELMIVIVIIGMLAAVSIPIYNNAVARRDAILSERVETVDGHSYINGVEIEVLPPELSLVNIERLPVPSHWVAETVDLSVIMHDCYFVIYRDPGYDNLYMVQVVLKHESMEILSVSTTRVGL